MKQAATLLLALWALLFVGGVIGVVFDVTFLREITDVKAIFLR